MIRKTKTLFALLLSALLALSLAACSTSGNPSSTAAPTTEPTAGTEPTGEPDATVVDVDENGTGDDATGDDTADDDATGDDTAGDDNADSDTTGGDTTQLPNPRVDYASVDELNTALGFTVMELDAESGYTAATFVAIDGTIGEVGYTGANGEALTLRTAAGTEDISGVYGATLTERTVGATTVHSGSLENMLVAWFSDGTTVCSLTAEGVEQEAFDALVDALAAALEANVA